MDFRTLIVDQDPRGVLYVALNRPQVRNAFNSEVIEDLLNVFKTEALRSEVRMIVLRGSGSIFCAGGDLNWMKKSIEYSYEENLAETRQLTHLFATLNECPKPVIGSIHGAAIGGGVGLVSICDIAIATEETQFSLSEVRLGIIPACIGPFVIEKIGSSHARALFMSAERFNAKRALEIGLIHEVVQDVASLESATERLVKNSLNCGPRAMSAAKNLILNLSIPERRSNLPNCLEYSSKMLAELRVSPEGQEGIRAFLEKRSPAWIKNEN